MPRPRTKCRHCDNKVDSREVCQKHATDGNTLIRLGLYTDDELVEKGYWAKAKPSGRPTRKSPIVEKLVKAKTKGE